mgnify:CR=1 FL=1
MAAQGQIIVNVAKGVEENTLMTLSQIIEEEVPQAEVAVLSGPSHAEEVGKGIPTTIVVGSKKKEIAEKIQSIFMNPVFRVYTSRMCLVSSWVQRLKMSLRWQRALQTA